MSSDSDEDALLFAAIERPSDQRAAFLDLACGTDTPVRLRLDRLLRELDDADPFLQAGGPLTGPLGEAVAEDLDREEALPPGTQVGAFRVLDELGRGGMAVVYRAERVDGGFTQQVALKLIKRGADTDDLLQRFRLERQIHASLAHPGIARLHDGGTAPDGRPFFAMELVEGERIDRYCAGRGLGLDARIDFCIQVARAVEHAHRHLVVHRDLKPSNILVNEAGEIKLLDFGIAKLLGDAADASADRTVTSQRMLTPQYASPEQVRGGPVTTASDVYQLGLLLFELVTGRAAQPLDGLTPSEAERVISEAPAPRPSSAAWADPLCRQWARDLRGEIDTIVLKALEKDPARRYGSAAQLADDLLRYRQGLPVHARPNSIAYRAAKFLDRHRVAAAAAFGVTALVVALVVFYNVRLAAERDAARREAATSSAVATFVADLFQSNDPNRSAGENLRARDLLDRGASRIDTDLAGQPEVQARLMTVVGDIYRQLGAYEPSVQLHERAVAARRARLPPDHPELADSLHALGSVLYLTGRFAEARPLLEEALRIREAAFGQDRAEVADSLDGLGMLSRRLNDHDAARDLTERALAIRERVQGPTHQRVGQTLNNLGLVYQVRGEYQLAQARYERALAVHEANHGPEHPLVGTTLGNLAEVKRISGDLAGAQPLLTRSLAITTKTLGPDHPDTGTAHNALGSLYYAMQRYDEARAMFERAEQIYTKALGPNHPTVAFPIENLGNIYKDTDHYDRALEQYARVRDIRTAAYGPVHSLIAQVRLNEGLAWRLKKDFTRAEPVLREALEVYRKTLPERHPQLGHAGFYLGATVATLGRYAEAEPILLEAYPILRDRRGPNHRLTKATVTLLASMYEAWGKPDQAAPFRALEKDQR